MAMSSKIRDLVDEKELISEMRNIGIDNYDILYNLNLNECIIVFSCVEDMNLYNLLGNKKEKSYQDYSIFYAVYQDIRGYFKIAEKKRIKLYGEVVHG